MAHMINNPSNRESTVFMRLFRDAAVIFTCIFFYSFQQERKGQHHFCASGAGLLYLVFLECV
jgi:hypothetical protein